MKRCLILPFVFASFSWVALANQPKSVRFGMPQLVQSGNAGAMRGTITVTNTLAKPLKITVDETKNDKLEFRWNSSREIVFPGESVELRFEGKIKRDGKHQLLSKVRIASEDGEKVRHQLNDMYFKVKDGKYEVADYEGLFLDFEENDKEMGSSFRALENTNRFQRAGDYNTKRAPISEMMKLTKESSRRIPHETGLQNDVFNPILLPFVAPDSSSAARSASNVTARGNFCFIGEGDIAHPAFGWRVRAHRKGFLGVWSVAAEDWVESDGNWKLNLPSTNGPYKFQYIAANEFFEPEPNNGGNYKWVGPERHSIGSNHQEGEWCADTSGGSVRGLGEMYDEGMRMWSKMFHEGGIDPLRNQPIKVIFPNTKFDCGNGDNIPWSCARQTGKIWLTPAHAREAGVIQHELAHQVNYEYWNNRLPSDAGGPHTLTECATPGLALTEGFANFMVNWVQGSRTSIPTINMEIEDPSFACTTRNKNESWVAATFWDLHDQHVDDDDNLHFVHMGSVPSIYLNAGLRDTMAGFHSVYRNFPGIRNPDIISDIFRQNHIVE